METSRFIEITDQELIDSEEEQENQNTKRKTAFDVELFEFHSDIKSWPACLIQHLFMSIHSKFRTTSFRNSSLALEKKMAPTMNQQV